MNNNNIPEKNAVFLFRQALKYVLFTVVLIVFGCAGEMQAQSIRCLYVDSSVTVSGNGNSWANAFKDLSEALTAAAQRRGIDSILVAKGTYYPSAIAGDGASNRDKAFVLLPNVSIIGGFPSGGGTWYQRMLPAPGQAWSGSILSGDIDRNDVLNNGISTIIKGSNAYHVVIAAVYAGVAIDGFTITGGNADAYVGDITVNSFDIDRYNGGGLYNISSSPAIFNCMFAGNRARDGGGGVLTNVYQRDKNDLTCINCYFLGNESGAGGAIRSNFSRLHVINSVFSGNVARYEGGAIQNIGENADITNCTFSANSGPAIRHILTKPTFNGPRMAITNSIIYGNLGGLSAQIGRYVVTYSLVQGYRVALEALEPGNIDGNTDPLFVNASGGDYRLRSGSPVINAGNNTAVPPKYTTDIAGHPRIQGGRVNMGAYEGVGE
jgi:hypothetical protein